MTTFDLIAALHQHLAYVAVERDNPLTVYVFAMIYHNGGTPTSFDCRFQHNSISGGYNELARRTLDIDASVDFVALLAINTHPAIEIRGNWGCPRWVDNINFVKGLSL